ncbi:hypothetical protein ES703_08092 [subsurface metagenome]|nr:hypothetical protein [bacterium]
MNAAEHIVEAYYRLKKKCFTVTDIKVEHGNNRQIDLLAFDKASGECFHVETSVTHRLNWRPSLEKIEKIIGYKFFGIPKPNSKDAENGKDYYQNICKTYELFGIKPKEVKRVICIWARKESEEKVEEWLRSQEKKRDVSKDSISILLFRDDVLRELQNCIGTPHYEDEALRILSLLEQFRKQTTSQDLQH